MKAALAAATELAEETRVLGCENEGLSAENIMLLRQSGASPSAVLKQAIPVGALDIRAVTSEAFAAARMTSRLSVISDSQEFRNKYEMACLNRGR